MNILYVLEAIDTFDGSVSVALREAFEVIAAPLVLYSFEEFSSRIASVRYRMAASAETLMCFTLVSSVVDEWKQKLDFVSVLGNKWMNEDAVRGRRYDPDLDGCPSVLDGFVEISDGVPEPVSEPDAFEMESQSGRAQKARDVPIFDEREYAPDLSQEYKVQEKVWNFPKKRSDPIPITGPKSRFSEPTDEPVLESVCFDLARLGVARTSPNKAVRPPTPEAVLPSVQCDIIYIDNKAAMKKIASYRNKVKVVTPKEKRFELRKLARQARDELRNPLRGALNEYEAQSLLDFSLTHNVSPQVQNLIDRVLTGVAQLSSMHENTVTQVCDGLRQTVSETTASLDQSMFGANGGLNKIFNKLSELFWIVPVVGAAYFAIKLATGENKLSMATGLSIALGMLLPQELWSQLSKLWPFKSDTEAYEAQSVPFDIHTLSHILTLCLTYVTIGKTDVMGITKEFLRSMPHYSRSVNGWKDLSSFIVSLVESFVNFIRESFGYKRISIYRTGLRTVDDWCRRVMEVVNSSHTGGDLMTVENVELICALRNEGRDLTNMFRLHGDVAPLLHKYLGYLDELCKVCSAAMHMTKGGRPPPVVMAITGKPGVGKTFLTKYIMSYVLSDIVGPERAKQLNHNFDSLVFQKGTTEYWNGYCGQPAIIVDDFAQSVPVPGVDNDFIELIRMNSSWAYPLNFADLENKGKNFFCSKVILLTTNLEDITACTDVIMEPEAIKRRIDFGYMIEVAPEFSIDGKIDIQKVKEYSSKNKVFPYHAWILRKHVFDIKKKAYTDKTQIYDLKSVLDEVKARIRTNDEFYESNNDIIKQMLVNYYEAQGSFFDYVKKSVYTDPTVSAIVFAMRKTFTGISDEFMQLDKCVYGIMSSPIFQFIIGVGASIFTIMLVRFLIKKVFSWFDTSKEKSQVIKEALYRKTKVPSDCVAQALNAFRPSDFEEIEVQDGVYRKTMKFTVQTLKKAYERMMGGEAQSNVPDNPRFVFKKVVGDHVIESDTVAQSDIYGNEIADHAYRNLFRFTITDGELINNMGYALMVRDTCALMPRHFRAELEKALEEGHFSSNTIVTFTNASNPNLCYNFSLQDYLQFRFEDSGDDDLSVVKLPRSVRAHRDIVDKFILDGDLMSLRKVRLRLDTGSSDGPTLRHTRFMDATRMDFVKVRSQADVYTLATGFEYFGYTKVGDCGGLVCADGVPEKMCRRILGLHVAGVPSRGVGLCGLMTKEKLTSLLSKLDTVEDKFFESQSHLETIWTPLPGSFLPCNKSFKTHALNPRTTLVKTKLHNAWGTCTKVPAPLRPFKNSEGKCVSPMEQAVLPYASPVISYSEKDVQRASYHAFSKFVGLSMEDERKIFTNEEACAGIPGTIINGIPRNTSPGYPYVLEGMSNKKKFFGTRDDYRFDSKECIDLFAEVDRVISDARKGIRNTHIFIDFLKDELRSAAKAAEGKTRLISSSPLVYVVAFRRYFLAFTSAVQKHRIKNGVAVGINPYTEWDYLATQLKTKGPHCVAGDFKGFDSSEQPDIHWAILDRINDWYNDGPENALIRRVLWMEVVHSRHMGSSGQVLDHIYQWNKSLPSGHPATSIINSFYNLTVFNLVWVDIMGLAYASRFWEFVYICVYGDDNILNISPQVVSRFNQLTIEKAMAARGMTYTSEDKLTETRPTRDLTEVSFLKRSFRYEPIIRKYVGNQDLESILFVPYWCKNASMVNDITLCNVEFTYTELSLHGSDVWDLYANKIKESVKEVLGADPQQLFTREEYVRMSQVASFVWPI